MQTTVGREELKAELGGVGQRFLNPKERLEAAQLKCEAFYGDTLLTARNAAKFAKMGAEMMFAETDPTKARFMKETEILFKTDFVASEANKGEELRESALALRNAAFENAFSAAVDRGVPRDLAKGIAIDFSRDVILHGMVAFVKDMPGFRDTRECEEFTKFTESNLKIWDLGYGHAGCVGGVHYVYYEAGPR
ncbi:Uncharacterised protein [uncultured archaeon]|nr:Uncharacterised protein [uncultured archaeon]